MLMTKNMDLNPWEKLNAKKNNRADRHTSRAPWTATDGPTDQPIKRFIYRVSSARLKKKLLYRQIDGVERRWGLDRKFRCLFQIEYPDGALCSWSHNDYTPIYTVPIHGYSGRQICCLNEFVPTGSSLNTIPCKRAPSCHERPKTQDIFYTVVMTLCPRRRNWSKMKRRKLRNKILLLLLRYETATAACIQQTLDVRTDSYFSLILQLKRFLWVLWGYYAVLITIEATRPQTKAYCHKPYTPRNHHLTTDERKDGQTNKAAL